MFELDSRLLKDCVVVGDLSLCRLLLMNDKQFPWFILVPMKVDVVEIIDLSEFEQQLLWLESAKVSQLLKTLFCPDKLNIAALGNVVSQLHVHHIGRYKTDLVWPKPVWGLLPAVPYNDDEIAKIKADVLRLLMTMQ